MVVCVGVVCLFGHVVPFYHASIACCDTALVVLFRRYQIKTIYCV